MDAVSPADEHREEASPRSRLLVVAALVTDESGRVLLTKRRADQALPLMWEFPGGKIEAGESPEGALARELEEEIAAKVVAPRIWEVLFHAYDRSDVILLVYACRLAEGSEPRALEVEDWAWVPAAELGGYEILEADAPLVQRLVREGAPRPTTPGGERRST